MNKQFRTLSAFALGLSLGTGLVINFATSAQAAPAVTVPANGAPKGPKKGQGGLIKSLGLTPAQKAKIKPIMDAANAQRKTIHDDTTLTPDARKAKMKAIRDATHAKVAAILTPAQKAKYKAGLAKMKADKAAKDKQKKA